MTCLNEVEGSEEGKKFVKELLMWMTKLRIIVTKELCRAIDENS